MRRLIVCADGTWNKPDEDDHGTPSPTNVVKIQRAITAVDDDGISQITFYHSGVGTSSDLLDKLGGGAFGDGLDRNILECYEFLVGNYTPGDELYFFGFSRGAYTVRSLAGLIRNSGLLKQEHAGMSNDAMQLYRDRDPSKHPDSDAAKAFRQQFSYDPDPNLPAPDFQIECVGVWDTVGALGIPLGLFSPINQKYAFHDVSLSRSIRIALHALAIDERRGPFKPSLWMQPKADAELPPDATDYRRKRQGWLEQAWFAGVHSNIGGGYAEAGLSDIAFDWMVKRVTEKTATWSDGTPKAGLQFNDAYVSQIVRPDPFAVLTDSLTPIYKALGEAIRGIDQDRKVNDSLGMHTWEYVHESAKLRQATPEKLPQPYNPSNLTAYLSSTDPGPTVAQARAV